MILGLKFLKPHEKCYRAVAFPATTLGDSYAYPRAQVFVVDCKLYKFHIHVFGTFLWRCL